LTDIATERRIAFIDWLKAFAIVCVVATHAIAQVGLEGQAREALTFIFGGRAVPIFLLLSGFLFSGKWSTRDSFNFQNYVMRNVKRLLVPWAMFTLLYAICRLVLEALSLTRETILIGNSLLGIAKVVYLSEITQQMYFLLSLFVIRLTNVWLVRLLSGSKWFWLAACALYMTAYHSASPAQWFFAGADPLLLALWGLQFYLLGIVLQKWHETLAPMALWLGSGCVVLGLGIEWSQFSHAAPFLIQLLCLVGIYWIVSVSAELKNWNCYLGNATMGIYLMHAPYILWCAAFFTMLVLPEKSVVTFLCVTALTVLASWMLTNIAQKTQFGRAIFGFSGPRGL
jgi:peptidoglycan/LPS O-acetylase OafA/YrhL